MAKRDENVPLTEDGKRHPIADQEPVLVPGMDTIGGFGVTPVDDRDPDAPDPNLSSGVRRIH